MYSVKDSRFFTVRVSPFGNPRVIAYFQLTAAYRRLSRPSSALSAKAFTLRSFSLEQPFCFFLHSVLQKFETNPAFIAWASQIIVFWVVRSKKTMIFRSYVCFVRLKISLEADEIVPTSFVRKNLYVLITSFSQLQLSVSFLFFIRFSMSIGGKTKFFHLGRPKWTRTTDLVLIRHAL